TAGEDERGHPHFPQQVGLRHRPSGLIDQGKIADRTKVQVGRGSPCPGSTPGKSGNDQGRQNEVRDKPTRHKTFYPGSGSQWCHARKMSGKSTIIIMVARMRTGKMMKYRRPQSNFRCIKNMATSTALQTATLKMITNWVVLSGIVWLTTNDTAVKMHKAPKM